MSGRVPLGKMPWVSCERWGLAHLLALGSAEGDETAETLCELTARSDELSTPTEFRKCRWCADRARSGAGLAR